MTRCRMANPIAPSSAAFTALRRVTGSRGSRAIAEEDQPVPADADQERQDAEQEPGPAHVTETDQAEQRRAECPGHRGDREGRHQGEPESDQGEQVEREPLDHRWGFVALTPLLGQRLAQVAHPADAGVQRTDQTDRTDRAGAVDRGVDDLTERLAEVAGSGAGDAVPQLRHQIRVPRSTKPAIAKPTISSGTSARIEK